MPALQIEDEDVRNFAEGLLSAIETPKFLGLRDPRNPDSIISPSDDAFYFWVRNESGVPVWNNTLYRDPSQLEEDLRGVITSDGTCDSQRRTRTWYFGTEKIAQEVPKGEGWAIELVIKR